MNSAANLLPEHIVQPFDLRYVVDDLHVMAFFEGHAVYEAVEAMIRRRTNSPPVVRAILTRHDQTQVDHVNDEPMFAAGQSAGRSTCLREITVLEESVGGLPRVKVVFASHAGETVMLDVICASAPDAARGGLSDPGDHAATSSLPVMWRGKSAFAGEATCVTIAGVDHPVPVKFRAGPQFVAHHGYFTDAHCMAIFRASEVVLDIVETPRIHAVGARWNYLTTDGERSYRITELQPDAQVRIERMEGTPEQLRGVLVGDRLELHEIRILAGAHDSEGATLAFDRHGAFTLRVAGYERVISGVFSAWHCGAFCLQPQSPPWAMARPVIVRITGDAARVVLSTTVGTVVGEPAPRAPSVQLADPLIPSFARVDA